MTEITVATLHVYPVKGCRGLTLRAAQVAQTGLVATCAGGASSLAGDREWMIVDAQYRFVTQRDLPALALIETALDADGLTLGSPGRAPIRVSASSSTQRPTHQVTVWRSQVRASDEGDAAASWLSEYLRMPLRLVRFDRALQRQCNPEYVGASGAHTYFADGYPLLIIGAASLRDLNARLARNGHAGLPMNRFRPNVVVEGLDPYDEDHVSTLTLDGVTLQMVKPCTRCQVTATDQATGEVGHEPLTTLSTYRHHARLDGIAFGMNAIVVSGAGTTLRAGARGRVEFRF